MNGNVMTFVFNFFFTKVKYQPRLLVGIEAESTGSAVLAQGALQKGKQIVSGAASLARPRCLP